MNTRARGRMTTSFSIILPRSRFADETADFLSQVRVLAEVRQPIDRQIVLACNLRRIRQPRQTQHQVTPGHLLNIPEQTAADRVHVFQSRISRTALSPQATQKAAQVSTHCHEPRPGGGHTRRPGNATDQAVAANMTSRTTTSVHYTFGFGAIATSSTRSPSPSFATPCGSPGSDHATPPGPRPPCQSPTVNRPSPSIT